MPCKHHVCSLEALTVWLPHASGSPASVTAGLCVTFPSEAQAGFGAMGNSERGIHRGASGARIEVVGAWGARAGRWMRSLGLGLQVKVGGLCQSCEAGQLW